MASLRDRFVSFRTESWDMAQEYPVAEEYGNFTGEFAFSPDSKILALASLRRYIELIDEKNGHVLARLEPPDPQTLTQIEIGPDLEIIAASTSTNRIQIWNWRKLRDRLDELGLWSGLESEPYQPRVPEQIQ